MRHTRTMAWLGLVGVVVVLATVAFAGQAGTVTAAPQPPRPLPARAAAADRWVVLAWNDLGMHCYNREFKDLAVLPPYNTLWAQVIKVGDPPQIVTGTVTVNYFFADNTYSVSPTVKKTDFWDYVQALFGVARPDNVGLAGKGLAGAMDVSGNHFEAVGIPLTEFSDSAPTVPDYYQLATIVVRDKVTGVELARTHPVAPVSTEMHCDNCHKDGGVEDIATGGVETNILTLHDEENLEDYPPGFGPLMANRPVLCADCHASNALGKPGVPGIPSLSHAMHDKHSGEEARVPDTMEGCYNCHPGPQTQCLRDTMSQRGMTCIDCHGGMSDVAHNSDPWLKEPRCDGCHTDAAYVQNAALYRQSSGHGGVSCAGCHDSPHAIATSRLPKDAIKFVEWQGHAGTLSTCTVCHATAPLAAGPHGILSPAALKEKLFLPVVVAPR